MLNKKNAETESPKMQDSAKSYSDVPKLIPHIPKIELAGNGFQMLPLPIIYFIIDRLMFWLDTLYTDRGALLPKSIRKSWKRFTKQILSADSNDKPTVCAARAGTGKTTWMLALILTFCEFEVHGYPAEEVKCLLKGGILLVVQKIDTLKEFEAAIEHYFPGHPELFTGIHSLSAKDLRNNACRDRNVKSFADCNPKDCRFAGTCKIANSSKAGQNSLITGITQARYYILRQNRSEMDCMCTRVFEKDRLPRRFLLFDERFDMPEIFRLNQTVINDFSNRIETLSKTRKIDENLICKLQSHLNYCIRRPFAKLRDMYNIPGSIDYCSLDDHYDAEDAARIVSSFESFKKKLDNDKLLPSLGQEGLQCMTVMEALISGKCLCITDQGFDIFNVKHPPLTYAGAQTIIFDATAGVDGDYIDLFDENDDSQNPFPAPEFPNLFFHIYTSPECNVSKTALNASGKLEGMRDLTLEILEHLTGNTYICTNKEYAKHVFPNDFPGNIAMMNEGLPYYGGTNGSNEFRECTNVILLGWPRLTSADFLIRCYANWTPLMEQQIEELKINNQALCAPATDIVQNLDLLKEYELHYLTARVEQEIYRCAARKHNPDNEIHVYLFYPQSSMVKLLEERFPQCQIQATDIVPHCLTEARSMARTYGGDSTAFVKLIEFFKSWDGTKIKISDLRDTILAISHATWESLMKEDKTRAYLNEHHIQRHGRGRNTYFIKGSNE